MPQVRLDAAWCHNFLKNFPHWLLLTLLPARPELKLSRLNILIPDLLEQRIVQWKQAPAAGRI